MFDTVGTHIDPDAAQRTATSAGIALGLSALGGLAFLLLAAATATAVVEAVPLEEIPIIEAVLGEEEQMDMAAPPPPLPPPAASAASEDEDSSDDKPNPDDMSDDVKELQDKVDPKVASQARSAGEEGGVDGGVDGGKQGGLVGGDPNGVPDGKLGGGPKVLHHSQLKVKRRVEPRYPAAAKGMGMGTQKCKVRVHIDEKGVPYDTTVEGCPRVFHESAQSAISQWRWYPIKDAGVRIKAQTYIVVKFVER